MKEAALLVLVAVVIVGGVGVWMANGGSLQLFSSPQPAAQPAETPLAADAAKETPPPPPKKSAKVRKAAAPAAAAPADTPVIAPIAEVVAAPPVPPPAPKEFPSANRISVGSERENIAEEFGQPALATTTTSDDGRVLETLVYARKSGRDVTVIRIEDGKVLSAHSR